MKQQLNIRASQLTIDQLAELCQWWNTNRTETITVAVDRVYRAEQEQRERSARPVSSSD